MRRIADLVVRWPWAVIGVWAVLAVVLPLSLPSLGQMAETHPLTILPADAPSSVTAQKMAGAFKESGNDDLLLVALVNKNGLTRSDEGVYRKLVDALRADADVVSVQDFVSTPQLRPFLTSEDKTTWVLPVSLEGELGTPRGFDSFNRVSDVVEHNAPTGDGSLDVYVTGPAATVADLTVEGQHDRLPIEIAIAVLVLAVLLLVYRSPVTMLLPLVTIGASLLIAQSVVAGYSQLTGAGVSNQSIVFLSAIMAGAGTDYAVFLISRYHDYLRAGDDFDHAVKAAMISIGKVISASAATVGVTFLLLSFAKMGVFKTVGVSSAIGIGVAFLAGVTLLPAILVLAGPRGWVAPRRELTARFWRRSGMRIVRRPVAHLVASVLVLALLAGLATFARYNYDDRKVVPASASSSVGYAALEQHFPISRSIPEYVLVQSPHDLRTPRALADLEQMASRVEQLPDVGLVSGITRPLGEVPPEFRATYQAGIVGDRLADGSAQIGQRTGDLNRLTDGADTLADSLADVRAPDQHHRTQHRGPDRHVLLGADPVRRRQAGARRQSRGRAGRQRQRARHVHGRQLRRRQGHVRLDRPGPGRAERQRDLQRQPVLQRHPRPAAEAVRRARRRTASTRSTTSPTNCRAFGRPANPQPAVNKLNAAMASVAKAVKVMGLDRPGGPEAGLTQLQQGANRLANGSRDVAGGVDELVQPGQD